MASLLAWQHFHCILHKSWWCRCQLGSFHGHFSGLFTSLCVSEYQGKHLKTCWKFVFIQGVTLNTSTLLNTFHIHIGTASLYVHYPPNTQIEGTCGSVLFLVIISQVKIVWPVRFPLEISLKFDSNPSNTSYPASVMKGVGCKLITTMRSQPD